MDSQSTIALLSLAFSLGIVHALDADHVMAVSNLIGSRPGFKRSLMFCGRWAVGHGAALFIIGFAVLFLGQNIPGSLSAMAEHIVGIMLVVLSLWVFIDLWRKNTHIHFHQHDGLPKHAHWHNHAHNTKQQHQDDSHSHQHGAVMIGVLHGTAGSAPLLALIPLSQIGSAWLGMAYLLLFALGVLISMLLFGGLFSSVFNWLNRFGNRLIQSVRAVVAVVTMFIGIQFLFGGG
jgi:ABC-type nickel/cobalt efflux system permease component RcnA